MTLRTIFARGDDEVFLTTTEAGNTSDGGDIPWTVVSPSNTNRIKYDNATPNPITGETVIVLDNTSGNVNEVRKTAPAAVIRGAWQLVFRLRTLPSSISVAGSMRSTAGGNIEARLSATNFPCLNSNGSTFDTAVTAFNTTDIWVWDVWTEEGTSVANGKAKHRVRKINSDGTFTTTHNGALFTDRNTGVQGTNDFDSWRVGKITSSSTMGMDIIQFSMDDGATDYCPNPVTGICGTDSTEEPWTVANLVANGLGSWSQVSGPAVTLGGSGNTRTWTVPASLTPATCVFAFGGDTCTKEILPATDAVRVGGVLVPVRLRTGLSLSTYGP